MSIGECVLAARAPALLILGMLLAPHLALGQTTDPAATAERPGEGGPADTVAVAIGLLDVASIDEKAQVFVVDAYIVFEWSDPRLAADAREPGTAGIRRMPLDSIWSPGLLLVNDRGLETRLPSVATVDGDGKVTVRQRVAGPVAVDLDLHDFPFDTQRLTLDLVSYLHNPSELTFSADSRLIVRPDTFSAQGWSFTPDSTKTSVFRLDESGPGAPLITFSLNAKRNAAYYVLTLAVPMTLVVLLSWVVHWVPPDLIAARIGMAGAGVFSLIALSVTFRLTSPPIDYMTRADRFGIYATILVAISLCATVAAAHLMHRERDADALRLTQVTRIVLPLGYLLMIWVAVVP